jgi:hypothetical protein
MGRILAHVHLNPFAVDEELAQVAEEEAPAAAPLVEVALAEKCQRRFAADAVEGVLVGDAASLELLRAAAAQRAGSLAGKSGAMSVPNCCTRSSSPGLS